MAFGGGEPSCRPTTARRTWRCTIADLAFTGGPILRLADRSAVFAGALGVVLVSIYLWGLLERRDKPLARLGIDSWVVVVVYVLGLVVLYGLRGRA